MIRACCDFDFIHLLNPEVFSFLDLSRIILDFKRELVAGAYTALVL